ncbi:MAG TPA: hypothetical protein VFA76_05600 [Terriglobales bacterium]|nr:hypothetical protein [Terriglobales bacterium]
MPLAVDLKPQGRLAQALVTRMNELDVTIRQLSERTSLTYEHIRKLAKGAAYPSKLALREVCRVLSLDAAKMDTLATADRIEKKYGGIPHALAGKHPELSLLAPWWDRLTEQQKQIFRIQIRSVAEVNEQTPATRKPPKPSSTANVVSRRARG